MKAKFAVLAGDGIGPEVISAGQRVLDHVASKYNHSFDYEEALIGGRAIDTTGNSFPDETIRTCEQADAILLGAVGGPKWDNPSAKDRPERGLLAMRKHFGLFANLRPIKVFPALADYSPLRPEVVAGVDILIVRELTGGLYFGARQEMGDGDTAYDTMQYTRDEIARVAHVAFRAAQGRRKKLTSVDKANVLASMRLWRSTVVALHEEYSDVQLEHNLVDSCAMHLITRPSSFDVLVAENMFGDILSDEASVLAGSLGMLPSASLSDGTFGLYEPIHGSAPDIAGKGIANPIGTILSFAMMLRYTLQLETEAQAIETAVETVLNEGLRTADLARGGGYASTQDFAAAVIQKI
jgi:3-isopropylmalate dehydrogenase